MLDYPPVWLTTYHMIEQIQMFRTLIPTVLDGGTEALKEFWLKDEDWELLEDLLAVMEPLRVCTLLPLFKIFLPLYRAISDLLLSLNVCHYSSLCHFLSYF